MQKPLSVKQSASTGAQHMKGEEQWKSHLSTVGPMTFNKNINNCIIHKNLIIFIKEMMIMQTDFVEYCFNKSVPVIVVFSTYSHFTDKGV